MKKNSLILTMVLALVILIGGEFFIVKWFVRNWRHDVTWNGERGVEIGTFAGCNFSPNVINADDEHFSEYWKKATKEYEFGFEDVAKEMPGCIELLSKELQDAENSKGEPEKKLTEEEINQIVNKQLDETMVYKKWKRPRKLTDEEKKNDYASVRESILRVDKKPSVEDLIKMIDELQNYQQKFQNREFSVFKNQN